MPTTMSQILIRIVQTSSDRGMRVENRSVSPFFGIRRVRHDAAGNLFRPCGTPSRRVLGSPP